MQKLSEFLFPNSPLIKNLKDGQREIIRKIAFDEDKRLCINCFTRYGKTQCVAIGICLYIAMNRNKKIALIAPQDEQTAILRNYVAELIAVSPWLSSIVDLERDNTVQRLKKEASKKRLTFKNGIELRTLSAHGEATRLMGFGADKIVIDEAALIKRPAYAKILRMLGDDFENATLTELSNPWDRDTVYYDHYSGGVYNTIHIGWEQGLKERRISQAFLDEMRGEITPIEFTVLYESEFPEETEDSLFNYKRVKECVDRTFGYDNGNRIISCDVADKGLDHTVIMQGYERDGFYIVEDIYSEARSENMQIVAKIIEMHRKKPATIINVDAVGVGTGVISRLRETLGDEGVIINACHFGEASGSAGAEHKPQKHERLQDRQSTSRRKRFLNKKAEQYFRLAELINVEGRVSFPSEKKLISDLLKMKFELTSSEKVKIVDPDDHSPDFADALCYFTWKEANQIYLDFWEA